MHTFIVITHVTLCAFLILVVLLQSGKSDMGAAFGGGGGNQNLGAASSGISLLGKLTGVVAAMFMMTSMTLAWYSNKGSQGESVMTGELGDLIELQEQEAAPAVPAPAPEKAAPAPQEAAPATDPAGQ